MQLSPSSALVESCACRRVSLWPVAKNIGEVTEKSPFGRYIDSSRKWRSRQYVQQHSQFKTHDLTGSELCILEPLCVLMDGKWEPSLAVDTIDADDEARAF